jgi:inosose dehydratase
MQLTRRNILLRAASLAGATWFDIPRLLAGTVEDSRQRFGGWDFGIQGHSLREYPIERTIEAIDRQLDLRWVEFSRAHLPLQPRDGGRYKGPAVSVERIREVKKLLAQHNVGMRAHGVNQFKADAAANRKVFELAKVLGVRNLSAAPSQGAFESLERLVEEFDIRIAIHNHGPSSGYPTTQALADALASRHPHIGVCLDTGHSLRSGEDPVEAVRILEGRIYGVHLKDVAEMKEKTESVVLGTGHLDVEGVFRALKMAKLPADAAMSLEFEGEPKDPVPSIQKCLEVAANAALKIAGESA